MPIPPSMTTPGCDVLLVGSVGLRDEEDVFRTASSLMGRYLKRIPDGEILLRADGRKINRFTSSQRAVLENHPAFEPDQEEVQAGGRIVRGTEIARKRQAPRFRLRAGVPAGAIAFETTHHAAWARASYSIFKRLKHEGAIRRGVRFQVTMPTTAAVLNAHVVARDHARVEEAYRSTLLAEVDNIAASIPHDELTIQWDISTEMGQLEGLRDAWWSNDEEAVSRGVVDRLAIHCNHVPPSVELGVHLCYGSFELKHWKEPDDTGKMVQLFNRLQERAARPIDYVHMPVPIARDDDAYFAPLSKLALRPQTRLYLGLIHEQDALEGARRRIAAARKHVADFGVATECGFAFRPAEALPELMRLHAAVAQSMSADTPVTR